ncbi:MAG: hypothetical protein U0174_11010 [Polyangiaceae bacterium]
MSDAVEPKRLLADVSGDASPFERELLSAGAAITPPDDMDARVWASLAANVGIATAIVGAATAAAPTTTAAAGSAITTAAAEGVKTTAGLAAGSVVAKTSLGLGAKAGIALLAIAVASGGTYVVQRVATREAAPRAAEAVHPQPLASAVPLHASDTIPDPVPPNAAPRSEATTSAAQPSATARRAIDEPSHRATSIATATATPSATASNAPTTSASEAPPSEAKYMQTARSCLARGDTACTRDAMSKAAAAGGAKPLLSEEREALGVRLAFAEGRSAEGRALARAFVAAHPKSPLAAAMTELAQH